MLDYLHDYENEAYSLGYHIIAGVDEVGRGCLAGPVMAAAVVLPRGSVIDGINDSKKLTPKKRELLFDIISNVAVSVGLSSVSELEIDRINILNATKQAMKSALDQLHAFDCVLVDYVKIPGIDTRQISIVKGDEKSISIAAASIIAKVTRDRLMDEYDRLYPAYNFSRNKGYGTKEHREAIIKYGVCPIHRKSFKLI